jgi:hypothetical protein
MYFLYLIMTSPISTWVDLRNTEFNELIIHLMMYLQLIVLYIILCIFFTCNFDNFYIHVVFDHITDLWKANKLNLIELNGCIFHGMGIRVSFGKTSEFQGGVWTPKPPPRYATVWWWKKLLYLKHNLGLGFYFLWNGK